MSDKVEELIAEARRLEGDYSDNYEVVTHMSVLAEALESLLAERDGALRAMSTHSCGENVEAVYRRTVSAEAERDALAAQIAAVKAIPYLPPTQKVGAISRLLTADPAAILRERDAKVWDEGYEAGAEDVLADEYATPRARHTPHVNPYRKGNEDE